MDLLADVGNSRLHLALCAGGELTRTLATAHGDEAAWEAYHDLLCLFELAMSEK